MIFVGGLVDTPGNGNNSLEFLPFVLSQSACGLVWSKIFRDGFMRYFSLISINSSSSDLLIIWFLVSTFRKI